MVPIPRLKMIRMFMKNLHEQEKAAFNSPASRRSRSPNKERKRYLSKTSPTTTKREGFTPNSDVLTTPMTTMSSTNSLPVGQHHHQIHHRKSIRWCYDGIS